ncbi:Sialidase domain-containing protein [Rhodovastum atsumiense]|uniref:Sialidase domain-containing protein n=1 Tax=Rhodovastum atsumiense TaxID=504468 RepID=A0A5M6IW19_9PROT|nr:exo-alpha-sialidase [Rhodovastum atsumiense]KAA5612149.1 hypothetical protein F1189_10805 [Rhodovastum atsumiense]CAH2603906.1 Sialidase domain-containing protein [Rhodovastum atsumiense]
MRLILKNQALLLPPAHGLFRNCHASTLVRRPDGTIHVAFFAGTTEGAGDTAIWTMTCQDGQWGTPRRILAEPGLAHWNPVLHDSGEALLLFYKVGPDVHHWITRLALSRDGGETWSAPAALVPGDARPRGPVRNKLLRLANGDWLAPGSIETPTTWDAFVDRSPDRGGSWAFHPVPLRHVPPGSRPAEAWSGLAEAALWETDPARVFAWDGVIQPTLWEFPAGHVHMLLRSTRGVIYRSDSRDGGRSWCEAYPTSLPNNNSGIDLAHPGGGRLVLACNPVTGNWASRTPLSLLCSEDNGASWSEPLHLETREGEFSYPAIIADGNRLHVTYTVRRENIACAVVDITT